MIIGGNKNTELLAPKPEEAIARFQIVLANAADVPQNLIDPRERAFLADLRALIAHVESLERDLAEAREEARPQIIQLDAPELKNL